MWCVAVVYGSGMVKRVSDVKCAYEKCRKHVPLARGPQAKYCGKAHADAQRKLRQYRKEAAENKLRAENMAEVSDNDRQKRSGEWLERMKAEPDIARRLVSGTISATAVAELWQTSVANVTRAAHAYGAIKRIESEKEDWSPTWRVQAMLPRDALLRLKALDPDSPEFEESLDQLVRAYKAFSRWYFRLEGKRPLVEDFHLNWIRSIIRAWATGGKQLILSPPRHGKSEMLIRFVVWFIVMYPNIRIGWFAASKDVAEIMLGAVKDHLEHNEGLIHDTLPPGETYKPPARSNKRWSANELKVAQQSHVGQKSSSLIALGLTSKFLSRDMDLIIVDDPEDFDSTAEPAQRKKARNKLAEVGTRKEEHTAEVFISSRQHPDDLGNHILAMEGTSLSWRAIVDTAHSEDCVEDPDDWDAHWDCMLFPTVRSYRWLMEKKMEMEMLGIPHAFSMRYLNRPVPEDGQVFDVEVIRKNALNRERGIGLEGLPLGYLVGGLDPSARGLQAAFLWHYRETGDKKMPVKMSMVDSDTERAGGVHGASKLIIDWYERYGVSLWYYETDGLLAEFYKLVREEVAKTHPQITIRPHHTGSVKMDPESGISAMAPLYHSGAIDLPYGTQEARRKVNVLLRQLELWTSSGISSKKAVTDLKMAQWFPFVGRIQKFIRKVKTPNLSYAPESSYRNVDSFNEAPWNQTIYPGS